VRQQIYKPTYLDLFI